MLLLNFKLTISDEKLNSFYNNSSITLDNKLLDLEYLNSASLLLFKLELLPNDKDLNISYNDSNVDKIKSLNKNIFTVKDIGKIYYWNF